MTSTPTTIPVEENPEPTFVDVWTRATTKYRVRAIVLLIINTFLFAGLGCFAYWLRTGVVFAPAQEGYWDTVVNTFLPMGDAHLGNFVLFPIRLDAVPVHGIVVGLLLAALVSVPILIAILYRLPASIPFILIVAFLAVMPWLAINIIGACVLATIKPFRFRFRYASALLGLLLVLLYFYGASRQSAPSVEHYAPADRMKFMAPWILATFASCLIMGIVLLLANLVNYRPGVVAPLLLIFFAVPVLVFERYVGRDELYYRLLEDRYQHEFGNRDGSAWFERVTRDAWLMRPDPRPPLDVFRQQMDLRLSLELSAMQDLRSVLADQKEDFVHDCKLFVRRYPDSRYAPNALYLLGQAADARVDLSAFKDKKQISYYHDFPLQTDRSELNWKRVVHNAPDSRISAVGRFRLAMLEARAGRIAKAVEWLDELISHYDPNNPAESSEQKTGAVHKALSAAPPDASLQILVENVVFDARKLRHLLLENGNDPRYGVRPLCGSLPGEPRQPGLLQIDPHDPHYIENLRSILHAYPRRSLLEDNLKLRIALEETNADARAVRLQSVVDDYPEGDARPEALYQLGIACLEAQMDARGRRTLAQLINEYPENMWAELAERRLRALPPPEVENAS